MLCPLLELLVDCEAARLLAAAAAARSGKAWMIVVCAIDVCKVNKGAVRMMVV